MRLRLIDDWRSAHRFASVRLSGTLALVFGAGPALFSAWGAVPADLKAALPDGWEHWIATAGFVLVLASRFVQLDQRAQQDGGSDGDR